ncbi:MAG: hypothetical protein ACYCST_20980 [Acidimicrobiales bacterium]
MKPMELGEGFLILGTVGVLLGGDNRVQGGNPDPHPGVVEDAGVAGEVFVAARSTWSGHGFHDVEGAGVGSPVGERQLLEDGVDLDWERGRLFVGEAGDAETSVEFVQAPARRARLSFSWRTRQSLSLVGRVAP